MIIIDATDLILGRLASFTAKKALLGETVNIVNCENAVISGSKEDVLGGYQELMDKGSPKKGPFYPRMPDRMIRRTIRGMLPYEIDKGKKALKRVMCYIGVPSEFKDKKILTIEDANVSRLNKSSNYVRVKDICKELGAGYLQRDGC